MISDNCRPFRFRLFIYFFFKKVTQYTYFHAVVTQSGLCSFEVLEKDLFVIIIVVIMCTRWILMDMSIITITITTTLMVIIFTLLICLMSFCSWTICLPRSACCISRVLNQMSVSVTVSLKTSFFRWVNSVGKQLVFWRQYFFYDWFRWQDTKQLVFLSVPS